MKYALGELKVVAKGDHWIAPNASVIGNVIMENNTSVWFNAVIRGDNEHITLGENSQVQDGAVLHADPGFPCTLGKNVSIGHLAMVHGCTIGDGTLVGIKSVILNGAVIGKNCLIENCIIDKNVSIGDGVSITNAKAIDEKDGDHYYIRDGIVIIPKGVHIPSGTKI